MIFGNKLDFAIESIIEKDLKKPSHPWGRMCIWVEGCSIGDFEDSHCGLYPAYEGFIESCKDLNTLWCNEFKSLSRREIWNFLDGRLYGYHGNEEIDYDLLYADDSNSEIYWKYNFLTNWGEMFDRGGKAFLLNPPNKNLEILHFLSETNEVKSFFCSEVGFREASKDFSIWFNEQIAFFETS